MTTLQALVKNIHENPNDTLLQKVFADYLQEQGCEMLAEYVRKNGCMGEDVRLVGYGNGSGGGNGGDGGNGDGRHRNGNHNGESTIKPQICIADLITTFL